MEMDATLHKNILKVVGSYLIKFVPFTQSIKLTTKLALEVDCDQQYELTAFDEIKRDDTWPWEDNQEEPKTVTVETPSDDIVNGNEAVEEENGHNGLSDDIKAYNSDTDELESFQPSPNTTEIKYDNDIDGSQCPVCQLRYDKEDLSKHIKTDHKVYCSNQFKCLLCKKRCLKLDVFVTHFLEEHCDTDGNPVKLDVEVNKSRKTTRRRVGKKQERSKIKMTKTRTEQPKRKTSRFVSKTKVEIDTSEVGVDENSPPENTKTLKIKIKNIGRLDKSIKQVNDLGPFDCSECGMTYSSKKALRRHTAVKHENIVYPCETCGKCFNRKESLYHHRRGLHSDVKKFKCTEPGCDAAFNFNHSLKLHILKHKCSRPHECGLCGKTYLTAHHLKVHIAGAHEQTKQYTCKICGKGFSYSSSLRVHEATHETKSRIKCEKCDKTFVNNQAMNYHYMSKHSDPGNFKCDVCNKVYNSEVVLNAHKRRHMLDKGRFMCDICGQLYAYKSALEMHKSVHRDDKKFTCEICKKTFKTYPTLYSHRFVHKEDSPYKCETCGKAFKTKERLRAHSKRHLGLKPFECNMCHHRFPDKGGLSKHMKTVHCPVKKFTCNICGKSTSRADNLRVHLKVHARGNVKPTMTVEDSKVGQADLLPSNVPLVIDVDLEPSLDSKKRRKRRAPNKVSTLPTNTPEDVDTELHASGDQTTLQPNIPHFSSIDPSQSSSALPGAVSDFVTDSRNASPASGIPAHIANENLVVIETDNSTGIETPTSTVKQVPSSVSAGTIFVTSMQPVSYMYPWTYPNSSGVQQGVLPHGYYQQ